MDEELLEKQIEENGGIEPQTPAAEDEAIPTEPDPKPEPPRTFTQEEVDRIAGNARAEGRSSALNSYLERHGVGSEDELEGLFADGQLYGGLNERYGALSKENADLKQRLALTSATLEQDLDPSAYEDVIAIAESKGLELSPETIRSLMETRPYWRRGQQPIQHQEGFSTPAPEPEPEPIQPAEPKAPPVNPDGSPNIEAMLDAAPAPQPQPRQQSVLTRIGAQPHASPADSGMRPEDLAKRLAGLGRR